MPSTVTPLGDRPFADLSARVETPSGLDPTRARLEITGSSSRDPVIVEEASFQRVGDHWTLSARALPLGEGENRVRVWAWNRDGRSLVPGQSQPVRYRKPPPPPPFVEIVQPGRDLPLRVPRCPFAFRVRSTSPLRSVELVRRRDQSDRAAESLFHYEPPPARPADHLERTLDLVLVAGDNALEVRAVNAGGLATARVKIEYVPPPVQVLVDDLVTRRTAASRSCSRISLPIRV